MFKVVYESYLYDDVENSLTFDRLKETFNTSSEALDFIKSNEIPKTISCLEEIYDNVSYELQEDVLSEVYTCVYYSDEEEIGLCTYMIL